MDVIIEPVLNKTAQKIQTICLLLREEHPEITENIIRTVLLCQWKQQSTIYYANNKAKVSEQKKVEYQKNKEDVKARYQLKKQLKSIAKSATMVV